MNKRSGFLGLRVPAMLLCLLCMCTATGCGFLPAGGEETKPSPSPVPPVATPAVDMAHARQAFQSGGELTYEEIIALRLEMVGDSREIDKINDTDKLYQAQDAFKQREDDFRAKLEKCKLKETTGWVAWWSREYDKDHNSIADKNRVAVYIYNPFYGFGKELSDYPEMFLAHFSNNEIAQLRYGQRIKFSGALTLVDRQESVTNPKYSFLDDQPQVAAPTANELKDLRITLDRTRCLGSCPDYTLTVQADGRVTFEGRNHTMITGTVTGMIDGANLAELAAEIKKAAFFSLDGYYEAHWIDFPTYTLTVRMDGQNKQVMTEAAGPRRLDILMDRIDQIIDSQQWIGDRAKH